jgi:hypothetical protein
VSSDTSTSSIGDPAVAEVFYAAGVQRMKNMRPFVELYGRLTPDQKKKIWSEHGLSYDEIADDPMFHGEGPTMGKAPIYNLSISLSKATDPASQEDGIYLHAKARVWLRDLPPEEREMMNKRVSPEALAKAATEPVEIDMGGRQSPMFPSNSKQVKSALEVLKKAREKADAKLAPGDGR